MSKQVRIGLIGAGNITHTHVQRLQEVQEAEIVAISDPSEASRQRLIEAFQLKDVLQFVDEAELLQNPEIDAVIISSPHTLHYKHVSAALAAGKHVLVEKPMTCTTDEAHRLIEQTKETGKVLQVSFQRHFLAPFMYIRSAIQAGEIGRLTSVNATLYQDWKLAQTGTWRQNASLSGGGMLMDSGSHIIDVLLWTTGLEPEEVSAVLHNQDSPVEVDTFTNIRFKGGAIGTLNIVGMAPKKCFDETYAFMGEDGAIFYNNGKITLQQNDQGTSEPTLPEPVTDPDRSFVDAILGKCEVEVPAEYALKVIELTEDIYRSAGYSPFA